MTITLVMIGPHGAGKTTIGRLLAERLGWPYHAEIGDSLRRAALAADPRATALGAQPNFDAEVFRRELARDRTWRGRGPRVVESWHPANLAYASLRSPDLAASKEPILRQATLGVGRVLVQPVWATPEILAARQREPGDVDASQSLFRAMAHKAEALALDWGLELLPIMDTSSTTPADCVATWMATHGRPPPVPQSPHDKDQPGERPAPPLCLEACRSAPGP
jgi:hypothetical protein